MVTWKFPKICKNSLRVSESVKGPGNSPIPKRKSVLQLTTILAETVSFTVKFRECGRLFFLKIDCSNMIPLHSASIDFCRRYFVACSLLLQGVVSKMF